MNIEPDIFDYLQTTALEPHDDYTSEITYKDQKIIWNRLKQQEKQLNKYKQVLDKIKEIINNKAFFDPAMPNCNALGQKATLEILKLLEETK